MLNDIKKAPLGKGDDPELRKFEIYFIAITGEEYYESAPLQGFGEMMSP